MHIPPSIVLRVDRLVYKVVDAGGGSGSGKVNDRSSVEDARCKDSRNVAKMAHILLRFAPALLISLIEPLIIYFSISNDSAN
jgi:hypothetical protein